MNAQPKQQSIEDLVFSYLLSIQPLKKTDPTLHGTRLCQLKEALTPKQTQANDL